MVAAAGLAVADSCEDAGRDAALLLMIEKDTCSAYKLTTLGQAVLVATTQSVGPSCVARGQKVVAVRLMAELQKADKASSNIVPEKVVCDEITKQLSALARTTGISAMYVSR